MTYQEIQTKRKELEANRKQINNTARTASLKLSGVFNNTIIGFEYEGFLIAGYVDTNRFTIAASDGLSYRLSECKILRNSFGEPYINHLEPIARG